MSNEVCPLCGRPMAEPITKHHLIPPSKGGKDSPTVAMHKVCQEKIHAVFPESELKRYYHTVERVLENEEIQKFVKWLGKKEPEFYEKPMRKK